MLPQPSKKRKETPPSPYFRQHNKTHNCRRSELRPATLFPPQSLTKSNALFLSVDSCCFHFSSLFFKVLLLFVFYGLFWVLSLCFDLDVEHVYLQKEEEKIVLMRDKIYFFFIFIVFLLYIFILHILGQK